MDYKVSYREKDGSIQCIISYKDGNGEWKTKSKQGFKTQKGSKTWQDETLEILEKQFEHIESLSKEDRETTWGKYRKLFLDDLSLRREANTMVSYDTAFKKFEKLDGTLLTSLTFLDIKGCVNDMIKKGLMASTINTYTSKVTVALSTAVIEYKLLEENPATISDLKLDEKKEKKMKNDGKVKALNKSELDSLLDSIPFGEDYMIMLLAGTCGPRIGEIEGLTWDDIKFKNSDVKFWRQWKKLKKDGTYGFGTLKSPNSYRTTPIPKRTLDALKLYKQTCVKDLVNNRLFLDYNTSNAAKRINELIKSAGFDITIHGLRHTYATLLVAKGVDFKTVAEYMGDTVAVVIETYAHFTQDMKDRGRENVEAIF